MDDTKRLSQACGRGLLTGSLIAVIMIALAIGIDAAQRGLDEGTTFCLSYLAAGLAGGILQQLWFNYHPTMRLPYGMRVLGFGLTYYMVLVGCAVLGRWLPASDPGVWVMFTIIFLAILAVLTLVITMALRRSGREYEAKLDEYHARRSA